VRAATQLLALTVLIAACSTSTTAPTPPSGDGTITGVVANNSGTGLAGVTVTVTPSTGAALPSVTTAANGSYTVNNVPAGSGVVAVSNLPATCTTPNQDAYLNLTSGATMTENFTVPCAATSSLVINITGANGVTPTATVAGPGGYSKNVSVTTTLTGLAAGTYTVTATPGATTVAGPIVNTTYLSTIIGSPAVVSATAVDTVYVSYDADGTGALWFDGGMAATAAQLGATATITPADSCNDGNYGSAPYAFDAGGNLWMQVGYSQGTGVQATVASLIQFDTAQLGIECDVQQPNIVLTSSALTNFATTSMAFDSHGTVWLTGNSTVGSGAPFIFGFTAAQLKAGGSQTPAITISSTSPSVDANGALGLPQWLAFDAAGNLWVGDQTSQILEYTPSQLTSSGAPAPAWLATTGTASDFPMFLAFDAKGNLWVVDPNYGTGAASFVSEFSKSELANLGSNQSPAPIYTMTASQTSVNWSSIAFDNSGNMWMLTEPTNSEVLLRYPAANIGPGGNGASDIAITASVPSYFGTWIAFNPTPTGLPLVGSRVAHRISRPAVRR
jgi:hypothetical protein